MGLITRNDGMILISQLMKALKSCLLANKKSSIFFLFLEYIYARLFYPPLPIKN